jgi:hypothetical protein
MRLFTFASLLILAATLRADDPATEPPPPDAAPADAVEAPVALPPQALLREAIRKSTLDAERWAYTQTVVSRNRDGKVEEEVVVRNDPSQPYEQQWTPLKINGKEPTEHQIEKYRKDHEKRRKSRRTLGELLDLAKATVVEENAATVTYEVPLLKNDNQRLPPEKFRVTARVNKERQAFENVAVRLRESLRVALILKLKSGEADLDFTPIDPQFAPPITALRADGQGTILFVKVGENYVATRTEFKRVKPYSERFHVHLAPMKFLDY